VKWLLYHGKRLARITAGVLLIVIAFLLGFVPGIPGWPLALVGLSLLAVDFVWAHRLKIQIQNAGKSVANKIRGKKQP